jgi:predicted peptidase
MGTTSLGGGATWYLGEKYPGMWTAICPSAGPIVDDQYPYDRLKGLPVVVLHSDMDARMSYDASLQMVEHAKEHGVDVLWLSVEGNHFEAWTRVASQLFDFFDQHKTKKK